MGGPKQLTRWLVTAGALVCAVLTLGAAAPAGLAAMPYRGVHVHSLWWESSQADMNRELDAARLAGSTTVRVDVAWGSLEESGKARFSPWYVAKLDRFMASAGARGMRVIVTLWATPCWASTAPEERRQGCRSGWWGRDVVQYPPANAGDFRAIARWVTSRYGRRLAALEVWNEPNLSRFWRAGQPARAYAELLRAGHAGAKAGNAGVPVLAASLSDSDRGFLSALYAAGIRGHYDGLANHPYADPGFTKLRALRATQRAHGDVAPMWVTEFGWPTGSDPQWHVSESAQAERIRRGFADLARLDWVRAAILYNLRDKGTTPTSMEDNFGVLRRDFTPKPGYGALTAALRSG